MKLEPYLTFNGQCEAAFKFYEKCLGGKITFMLTNGNSPMADQVPTEWHDKIMHATFTVGDEVLMGADSQPESYQDTKRLFRYYWHQRPRRGGTHLSCIVRKRDGADADSANFLGGPFWRACRSVWHTLDH